MGSHSLKADGQGDESVGKVEAAVGRCQALRHGSDDYLRKPFDGAGFRVALDRTISCLTLTRQHATLRRYLGTEQ